jgi:hypothetical protein
MAFLRETVRSLRAYLIFVGALGILVQVLGLPSPDSGLLIRVLSLVGLAISLAYVWLGIVLRSLLTTAPRRIVQVLVAGALYSILLALIVILTHVIAGVSLASTPDAGGTIGRAIGGFLITLYLLKNVRRLADESQRLTQGQ